MNPAIFAEALCFDQGTNGASAPVALAAWPAHCHTARRSWKTSLHRTQTHWNLRGQRPSRPDIDIFSHGKTMGFSRETDCLTWFSHGKPWENPWVFQEKTLRENHGELQKYHGCGFLNKSRKLINKILPRDPTGTLPLVKNLQYSKTFSVDAQISTLPSGYD